MNEKRGTRLADLRVQRWHWTFFNLTVWVLNWALWRRRAEHKKAVKTAEEVGRNLAKLALDARANAKSLRRFTIAIAALTAVNTAFVIYSAVR
ncbi:MAG TPA: hypothetical protein VGG41_07065 [Solirubrobacteraceae bacterium]|jgi:hypothetical protein